MTRRKGKQTARTNERECPHIVELAVPFRRRGRRQWRGEQEYVRFCFADAATVDAFQASFSGERVSRKQ